jgi:hypothetical protein
MIRAARCFALSGLVFRGEHLPRAVALGSFVMALRAGNQCPLRPFATDPTISINLFLA